MSPTVQYLSCHHCGEVLSVSGHLPQGRESKQVQCHQAGHWVACRVNTHTHAHTHTHTRTHTHTHTHSHTHTLCIDWNASSIFIHKWHSQLQHCMYQAGPNHSPGRAKRSFLLPSTSRVANVVGFLHTKQQYKFNTNIDVHIMSCPSM